MSKGKGSVLIIDDDEEIRESIQMLLVSEGLSVDTAVSGEDGLLKVVFVSEKEREELPVKIEKGAWLIPTRTFAIGREYTLEALMDGKPMEKLRLRVKAGTVVGSPCQE